jgi:hypothetical protein
MTSLLVLLKVILNLFEVTYSSPCILELIVKSGGGLLFQNLFCGTLCNICC